MLSLFQRAARLGLALSLLIFPGRIMAEHSDSLDTYLDSPPRWDAGNLNSHYTPDNLYEYLDGGAERYLGYGFRELRVREYLSPGCPARVTVEIYRMDSPADAFGIWSSDRAGGEESAGIGTNAVVDPSLLQFWQGRFFVRVQDGMFSGGVRDTLLEFGRLISRKLPPGRPEDTPALTGKLPLVGRIEKSLCYFHSFNSLNSFVYLGQENSLGLGPQVEAVTAEYHSGPGKAVGRAVLVRYPDSKSAREALNRFAAARGKLPQRAAGLLTLATSHGNFILFLFNASDNGWSNKLEAAVWSGLGE